MHEFAHVVGNHGEAFAARMRPAWLRLLVKIVEW